jgi:hypothetical protein
MNIKILVACEESRAVTIAFRELGYEAYSCDLLECSGGHPEWHIQGDAIKEAYSGKYGALIGHPPCTRLANSGVRWLVIPPKGRSLVSMWRELFEGAEFYKALRDAPIPLKCIENPVMHKHAKELIKLGKRQVVQPWWFGEKTFKSTGYELVGLPDLIPTNKLIPPKKGTDEHRKWSWIHLMSPGPNRSKLRSKTPVGIARAMAEQWGGLISGTA